MEKCGFDNQVLCTEKCKHFNTCSRKKDDRKRKVTKKGSSMMLNLFEEVSLKKADFAEFVNESISNSIISVEAIEDLNRMAYFAAPAGESGKCAKIGGLYEHSKAVACMLCELTHCLGLEWTRPQSPLIIGFFHDIYKINVYDIIADPNKKDGYEIIAEKSLRDKGEESLYIIHAMELKHHEFSMTDEEKMCIRYMTKGFSSEDDTFDDVIKRCPNIIYAHMADMITSKI